MPIDFTLSDGPDIRDGLTRFNNNPSYADRVDDSPSVFLFEDVDTPPETDLLPDEDYDNNSGPKLFTNAYDYDVAIIGSGPAGQTAAVRAAKLGANVIMFEKDALGGLWLNSGCIPSKVYLKAGEGAAPDLHGALSFKNNVVTKLTSNAARLLRSCRVRIEAGEASLKSPHEVLCRGRVYSVGKIILCGGSKTDNSIIPGATHSGVWTTEGVFKVPAVPPRLLIIGGGADGCELAAAFSGYGSNVMLVEAKSRLLPNWDRQISETVGRSLTEAGVKVHTGVTVNEIVDKDGNPYVITERGAVQCDKVLLATARKSDRSFLGALERDFKLVNGDIAVNKYLETSVPGIYAAGDITRFGSQTHIAYKMAETAAVNAMGGKKAMDLRAAHSVLYTKPEAASVGLTEDEAREKHGDDFNVGYCPLSANIKAIISGTSDGFVKALVNRRYGELYGVHIVGVNATEMIAEPAALMRMEVTAYEIIEDIFHAHPTYVEAFAEACADALGKSIHLLK